MARMDTRQLGIFYQGYPNTIFFKTRGASSCWNLIGGREWVLIFTDELRVFLSVAKARPDFFVGKRCLASRPKNQRPTVSNRFQKMVGQAALACQPFGKPEQFARQ